MKLRASVWHYGILFPLLLLAACGGQPANGAPTQAAVPVTSTQPAAAVQPPATSPANSVPAATSGGTATGSAAIPVTSTQGAAEAPTTAAVLATAALPICTSPANLTPSVTEGPYFKPGSPERTSLVDSLPGTKLTVTGYVLSTDCKPVAHALLDFWQADSQGNYDNSGYTLRGHQYTDANGRYQLETIVPGLYPGRTEHIHVKVQAPNGQVLTTQLFFPGVSQNQSDGIYDQRLLLSNIEQSSGGMTATFDFIVATK